MRVATGTGELFNRGTRAGVNEAGAPSLHIVVYCSCSFEESRGRKALFTVGEHATEWLGVTRDDDRSDRDPVQGSVVS